MVSTPLKNMSRLAVGMMTFPIYGKNIKSSKPPTRICSNPIWAVSHAEHGTSGDTSGYLRSSDPGNCHWKVDEQNERFKRYSCLTRAKQMSNESMSFSASVQIHESFHGFLFWKIKHVRACFHGSCCCVNPGPYSM